MEITQPPKGLMAHNLATMQNVPDALHPLSVGLQQPENGDVLPVSRDAEYETYLRVKAKRDEYRRRCASANLSNTITRQQDIDGANMEDYCRNYETQNGLSHVEQSQN